MTDDWTALPKRSAVATRTLSALEVCRDAETQWRDARAAVLSAVSELELATERLDSAQEQLAWVIANTHEWATDHEARDARGV